MTSDLDVWKPGDRPCDGRSFPRKRESRGFLIEVDSRFLPAFTRMTGNDGLKNSIHPIFGRNRDP